ncbi:GNAT family N-acetyltransferase [Halorarum halobium]|uniref:GNAT family N-acetyltransferase n=1 Tax=Halorarum halobium TaxID=3075121 RepID=UPI0028A76069|nr:GNAT family N-acetyltransferase [Halobaculum sp. XH14]
MTAFRAHRTVADVNENQWNHVVSQSERGTLFHRHEWIRALEDGFEEEGRHVVVEKKGNPVAVLPNVLRELPLPDTVTDPLPSDPPLRMVTSSSPGFGGPLLLTDERESLDLLFDGLESSVGRGVVFHRLESHDLTNVRYGQQLQGRGYEPTFHTCLFVLDIDGDWESVRSRMDKERRKDLREAHEQEYRVEVSRLGDDLDATYEPYVANMERVDGTVLPRAFLESLAEEFGDRVRVFTAVVDGREVGRYVHLLDEEASVLHHWLSAVPDASNYQYHPSELLHEHAIKFGMEHGFDEYGFGKTGAHFRNSVFGFKQKYGARAVPLFSMEKGLSPVAWPLYKFGRRRYQRRGL